MHAMEHLTQLIKIACAHAHRECFVISGKNSRLVTSKSSSSINRLSNTDYKSLPSDFCVVYYLDLLI